MIVLEEPLPADSDMRLPDQGSVAVRTRSIPSVQQRVNARCVPRLHRMFGVAVGVSKRFSINVCAEAQLAEAQVDGRQHDMAQRTWITTTTSTTTPSRGHGGESDPRRPELRQLASAHTLIENNLFEHADGDPRRSR